MRKLKRLLASAFVPLDKAEQIRALILQVAPEGNDAITVVIGGREWDEEMPEGYGIMFINGPTKKAERLMNALLQGILAGIALGGVKVHPYQEGPHLAGVANDLYDLLPRLV